MLHCVRAVGLSLILCPNRFYDQYHPASRFCAINQKNIGSSEIILWNGWTSNIMGEFRQIAHSSNVNAAAQEQQRQMLLLFYWCLFTYIFHIYLRECCPLKESSGKKNGNGKQIWGKKCPKKYNIPSNFMAICHRFICHTSYITSGRCQQRYCKMNM